MKKVIVCLVVNFCLVISVCYFNYVRYCDVINMFVSGVLEEVKDKYPEVNSEDIIKIINGSNGGSYNTLKKYGFSDSDLSYLSNLNSVFNKNIIISGSVFGVFSLLSILIYWGSRKKKMKEIENITNYLKRINNGNYDLEILDNVEGNLSILKNEIYTTTICLKSMYANEVEQRIKIKDNLADISHQLKTPLTSIMLMVDTLLEENVSEDMKVEYLNDIKIQIENINFLIIALLKLSRFDANVVKFEKSNINVKKMIMDVLKNVDIIRELNDVNIHVNGKSDVFFVGDYKWECEAITNIVKNAIEHSGLKKDVYINYKDNGMYVSIDIIDNGEGISQSDIKHIFERFYKGSNSDNNFGIGLSLAKEIIKKDNGSIRVISNNGTKFSIRYYK